MISTFLIKVKRCRQPLLYEFCLLCVIIVCMYSKQYQIINWNPDTEIPFQEQGKNDIPTQQKLHNDKRSILGFHQWCKSNQIKNMSYTKYADKHLAKEYVNKVATDLKTAKEFAYVSEATSITDKLLQNLQSRYIFKPNHMCGEIVIKDGNNINCLHNICKMCNLTEWVACLQKLCSRWLSTTYSVGYELYYKDIAPKCMFEELLGLGKLPIDYRVFTFYGKPYFIHVEYDIHEKHTRDVMTPSWKRIRMKTNPKSLDFPRSLSAEKPLYLNKMLHFAELLSKPFIMMRIDFYGMEDDIAFSEFSPSHQGCHGVFKPERIEQFYGEVIQNPNKYTDPDYVLQLT